MPNEPHGTCDPHGRAPASILEELAGAVMSTDASDGAGVDRLLALLDELAATQDPVAGEPAAEAAARVRSQSADVRALTEALDAVSEEVARLQEALAKAARPQPAPAAARQQSDATADPGALVLSDWGDEKVLRDFLAAQRGSLEDLEKEILGMEGGDPERRGAFKRRLHTMKGEAGVLGLADLERVCHATEDFVETCGVSAEVTDRLLKVRDWMARAADGYARLRLPQPSAAEFVAAVLADRPAAGSSSATSAQPVSQTTTPAATLTPTASPTAGHHMSPSLDKPPDHDGARGGAESPIPPSDAGPREPLPSVASTPAEHAGVDGPGPEAKVTRDDETISLFGEFLSESAEGLNRVDQILMNVERDGVNSDTVNSLFRVFHTVKGTAGFLDLTEIISLAHDTETMLNKCRENTLVLKGAVVDLVFDATSALREMLAGVRAGIEAGTGFSHREGLGELLKRIEVVTEGGSLPEKEVPIAEQGEKLGEVITHPPIGVAPEAVEKALQHQAATGRRLGEELVALGEAEPAQVAQALRAQSRVAPPEQEGPLKLKETIKVDLERVDSLVEMIGELVVVESMVVNAPEISKASSVRVRNCLAQLAKVTRDLQDVGMRMRMVPVAGVFQKMARLVRDLSRKSGKQVRLATSGESTEMDRSMVEQIADPLVHMIRNACDHGLEPSEVRTAAGKAPVGQVRLSAYHEGGSVVIEITDDGRGLDKAAIVKKAMEKGLISSADGMSEAEIHGLIFAPGFSTAAKVTEISGRGVGMDVVKRNIDAMRGRVLITSTLGEGTKFKLVLPLTLAIIDGMLVACGTERYVIPTLSIVESIQPDRKMLVSLAQRKEMINLRGEILPLLRLNRLFGLPGAKSDPTEALVVVVEGVGRRLGLLVDEVVTQQQVVIKSLGEGMGPAQFVSGAAILSDGRVGLILNVEEIAMLIHKSHDFFHEHGEALLPSVPTTSQEAQA
jgi:two-component system chemotaxis sensor kinase CheA